MLRLCSESSRSYPGRSVQHALSLLCNNSRHGPYRETKAQASPAVADGDESKRKHEQWATPAKEVSLRLTG